MSHTATRWARAKSFKYPGSEVFPGFPHIPESRASGLGVRRALKDGRAQESPPDASGAEVPARGQTSFWDTFGLIVTILVHFSHFKFYKAQLYTQYLISFS